MKNIFAYGDHYGFWKITKKIILAVILIYSFFGCHDSAEKNNKDMLYDALTTQDIRFKASNIFKKENPTKQIDDYRINISNKSIEIEGEKFDCWEVEFLPTKKVLGGGFVVIIDKKSGQILKFYKTK
jgi:hypothetical protein